MLSSWWMGMAGAIYFTCCSLAPFIGCPVYPDEKNCVVWEVCFDRKWRNIADYITRFSIKQTLSETCKFHMRIRYFLFQNEEFSPSNKVWPNGFDSRQGIEDRPHLLCGALHYVRRSNRHLFRHTCKHRWGRAPNRCVRNLHCGSSNSHFHWADCHVWRIGHYYQMWIRRHIYIDNSLGRHRHCLLAKYLPYPRCRTRNLHRIHWV